MLKNPPHLYDVVPTLQKAHGIIVAIWLPLTLLTMCLSCFFAYVGAKTQTYTDTSEYWQACYNKGGTMTIPLSAVGETLANLYANLKLFVAFFCTKDPLPDTIDTSKLQDIPLAISSLAGTMSYQGVQSIMFTTFAHSTVYRAWNHPSWIPSSIVFVLWCCFATLTYYTLSPLLPVPTKTNSTLLVLMRYSTPDAYRALGGDSNDCDTAYDVAWVYLSVQLLMAISVFVIGFLLCIGEWARQHTPNRKYYAQLRNTIAPTVAICISMAGYLLFATAKADTSFLALKAIGQYKNTNSLHFDESFFPFQSGTFDISTILFVLSFMSVCRGATRQSVSSYRLATASSFLYVATAFPAIVAAITFYWENELYNDQTCSDFFEIGKTAAYFGYPDHKQAVHFCADFRLALAAGCIIFGSMWLQGITCFRTFADNMDRPSGIFDPIDPANDPTNVHSHISGLRTSLMDDPDKATYKY